MNSFSYIVKICFPECIALPLVLLLCASEKSPSASLTTSPFLKQVNAAMRRKPCPPLLLSKHCSQLLAVHHVLQFLNISVELGWTLSSLSMSSCAEESKTTHRSLDVASRVLTKQKQPLLLTWCPYTT